MFMADPNQPVAVRKGAFRQVMERKFLTRENLSDITTNSAYADLAPLAREYLLLVEKGDLELRPSDEDSAQPA